MKFRACLVAVFSLLLVSCGGKRLAVDPQWKTPPKNFTILVSEPYVANSDDVTDDFGDEDSFKQWLLAYMDSAFSSYTEVPHTVMQAKDESFIMSQVPLEDGYIAIPLPEKEKIEEISGIVVSIHPIRFWRDTDICHNRNGCIGNNNLNLQVMYSIVSVDDTKVLAYGGAYDKSSFTFAMTKGDWESVVKGIAKKVVKETPLEK